jgi:hypothetical protein
MRTKTKPKKAVKPKKRKYTKKAASWSETPEFKILEIEDGIPMPIKEDRYQLSRLREASKKNAEKMKAGQSFVVPAPQLSSIMKTLRNEVNSRSFRGSAIKDAKGKKTKFARIWRRS